MPIKRTARCCVANPFLTVCLLFALIGCAGGSPSGTFTAPQAPPNEPSPSQPPPVPQQAGSVIIQPQNAAIAPGQALHFTAASGGGSIEWLVNGVLNGNATVGTIRNGDYTAPSTIDQSENIVVKAALVGSLGTNFASAVVAVIQPGTVTPTSNPLVAEYSIYLPQPGSMTVQFGQDTGKSLNTWSEPTPSVPRNYGGQINVEVAGMQGTSTYHMQGLVTLANGATFQDRDHTFTTGPAPPTVPVQISTPSGQTPQPGVELFDTIPLGSKPIPNLAQAFVTDLAGRTIWTYSYKESSANIIFPIKLLPNGHFLMVIGYVATPTARQNIPSGTISVIREVDLIGNTVRELTMDQLNKSLAESPSIAGDGNPGMPLLTFSTDVLQQPNGHLLLIAWATKPFTNLPGHPGTFHVLGNVIVDVDRNFQPTWVWNSFDHLDLDRFPYQFPDFTHANALLYSPTDHDLLLSVRQQNWIIKIDYQDGKGTGNVIWRLGEGGDFKLVGSDDPADWFYAQHGMNFFSPSTSGVFSLGIMDNGNDRLYSSLQICGTSGAPACYSAVKVFRIDETARTAVQLFNYVPTPNIYSYFGGQADLLQNGDIEADFCTSATGAIIDELDPTQNPAQIVWRAQTPGYDQYRVTRIPSLYPGVQW